jgi:Zn-dependent peptidase ImmA (M78 family)
MTIRLDVSPVIWQWLLETTPLDDKLAAQAAPWIEGDTKPTLNQIKAFSKKIYVPYGYFMRDIPPNEECELIEFRTVDSIKLQKVNRNLLDVFDQMRDIQDWMRSYVVENNGIKDYVGSIDPKNYPVADAAMEVMSRLNLGRTWFENDQCSDKTKAFKYLRDCISGIGVTVMMSGIVGNNTKRTLDVEEFRAFALIDNYAPLIFINGRDSVEGKIFSIFHELVHIFIGKNNLYNVGQDLTELVDPTETFCNRVSAEIVVPVDIFEEKWKQNKKVLSEKIVMLSAIFKCSQSVVVRRAYDFKYISAEIYKKLLGDAKKIYAVQKAKKRGNYYKTMATRIDNPFLLALYDSVKGGRTLLREAFQLTNTNMKTFFEIVREVKGDIDDW